MPKAKSPKRRLTTTALDRLTARGERYELRDTQVPGLCVRVSERGARTFVLKTRFPGSPHPTRRALGEYPVLGLEDAREKGREWLKLIGRGIDPAQQEKLEVLAEQKRRKNTFAAVYADFAADKLSKERRGKGVEREFERDLLPTLSVRPVTEISDDELAAIIKTKARTAPTGARNLLATVKRFFNWAIDQRAYGIKLSPAAGLKPKSLCGSGFKRKRERVLSDDELVAFWRATTKLENPCHTAVYRLLLRCALRLNEAARAEETELDARTGMWTIPAERMKGRDDTAREHVVPLIGAISDVFDGLPAIAERKGDFLFSTTWGNRPIWIGDKVKKQLDVLMLGELRAMASERGEDPAKVKLRPWVNHDLRRTVRSRLSRLKVTEEAREAVLAHARPGIKGVYDKHDYFDEKCEALELWNASLARIVADKAVSATVVRLRAHA